MDTNWEVIPPKFYPIKLQAFFGFKMGGRGIFLVVEYRWKEIGATVGHGYELAGDGGG